METSNDVIFNFTPQTSPLHVLPPPHAPHKSLQEMTSDERFAHRSSDDDDSYEEWANVRFFATPQMVANELHLPQTGLWDVENVRTNPQHKYIDEEKMQRMQRMLKFKIQNGFLNYDDFKYICQSVRILVLASFEMELYLKEVELLMDAYEKAVEAPTYL